MSEGTQHLRSIAAGRFSGVGIPSLCSANEYVLKAALRFAKQHGDFVLIEATANQVNQYGGYTGMTPDEFRRYVHSLADEAGLDRGRVILGGDHLGPVVFHDKDEADAMREAKVLVSAFVEAGFEKIHIDTSMRLWSDPEDEPLTDDVIAARGAVLCEAAETAFEKAFGRPGDLVYVIGSEVPVPGGTLAGGEELTVTRPDDFARTLAAFESAFAAKGLSEAFSRVIAAVVQPGVEFGDDSVDAYDASAAAQLTAKLHEYESIVFEGHSTDYQTQTALSGMVKDGICILKVGPELTFALREGLFALQYIAAELGGESDFIGALDRTMCEKPGYWQNYYTGTSDEIALKRAYSYSDRWRYYAGEPVVSGAIASLLREFDSLRVPRTLISQHLPVQYRKIMEGQLTLRAEEIVADKVMEILEKYRAATICK